MNNESISIKKTKEIYNQSAEKWQRKEPNLLTDFSARALIFDLSKEVSDKKLLIWDVVKVMLADIANLRVLRRFGVLIFQLA